MHSLWTLFCNTKNERKARKVSQRLFDRIGLKPHLVSCEFDCDDGGYFCVHACAELQAPSWDTAIVELVKIARRVGDDVRIHGDAHNALSLVACRTFIPGISICEIEIWQSGTMCLEPENWGKS